MNDLAELLRARRWIVLVALATVPAVAQVGSVGDEPYLMELRTKRVMFRYTPGSLDRATRLEEPLELLVEHLASWTKQPVTLLTVLLSREEWGRVGLTVPYGLPGHLGPHDVVLPAWGDDQTVELWRDLLGRELPSPMDMSYGGNSRAYASLNMTDTAMLPEATRAMLRKAGYLADKPWAEGVAVHAVALSALKDDAPGHLTEARYFWQGLLDQGGGPAARTLEEAAAGGPAERLWLEASYFMAAWEIVAAEGKSAGKSILKTARKTGDTVTAANLIREYPFLGSWLDRSFAPAGSPGG